MTSNFVLPVDAVEKESLRWLEKPSYNRVVVSGQEAGVLARVTRSGTAGDSLAPMVVDALITEAAVARQRGLAVLSDTGRQIEVSLNLPVLVETGIIEPGAFVQYCDAGVDWKPLHPTCLWKSSTSKAKVLSLRRFPFVIATFSIRHCERSVAIHEPRLHGLPRRSSSQ